MQFLLRVKNQKSLIVKNLILSPEINSISIIIQTTVVVCIIIVYIERFSKTL